ncbi:MAG: cytochrome c [Ignavibacteriaceae bacterium]|nr:cytochrome c [Ignavibacteriaceae bacterium]
MHLFKKNGWLLLGFTLLFLVLFFPSCGDKTGQDPSEFRNKMQNENTSGLTEFELENGIGPIKQKIEFGPIDPALVKKGKEIFDTKCASCHKLDEKYVGPPQRDVFKRRSPEYILNFMLNPEENYKKHPEAKKLLGEYLTQMPNQNLTIDEAKAMLDFFRKVADEK